MPRFNSREQTIYRNLLSRIQSGVYSGGDPLPAIQEIAAQYRVSYSPVQRAFKALERDGLIRLGRGKGAVVLSRPYEDYLGSPVFQRRIPGLIDLGRALKLLSAPLCFQGLCSMDLFALSERLADTEHASGKHLFRVFGQAIEALGSRTAASLYNDIGVYVHGAYQDIIRARYGREAAEAYWKHQAECLSRGVAHCRDGRLDSGISLLEGVGRMFFDMVEQSLGEMRERDGGHDREDFVWEPYRGRTKYSDVIAIDLLRKISQGIYPVGSRLPNGAVLADVYHVSEMTIRRSIWALNTLGVVKTRNGAGTYVLNAGDALMPYAVRNFTAEDNYRIFLEAYQLFAVTCESVIAHTLPHCPDEAINAIAHALEQEHPAASSLMAVAACLQAVVRHCPLAAIREIYGKLTLQMLSGNVLLIHEGDKDRSGRWREFIPALRESLAQGDANRFARAFRLPIEDIFRGIRDEFMAKGITGIEGVVAPIGSGAPR